MNCEVVHQKIVQFLQRHLDNSGLEGFVVGVSGGVDSALVSTLCGESGCPTVALSLPVGFESDGDRRAERHLDWLSNQYENVSVQEVPMDNPVDAFQDTLESEVGFEGVSKDSLTIANLQSRLRMCMLYSVANHQDRLVVGTGNKIEDEAVGFFTKFGDGGVDLSPIGDLLKTEVWELADYLGVNEEIIEAQPTDGLWEDNRPDSEQLGMTYPEMEKYLRWKEKGGTHPEDVEDPEEREKYKRFLDQHNSTRHKMKMPPICSLKTVK